jgi:hypothetical protein
MSRKKVVDFAAPRKGGFFLRHQVRPVRAEASAFSFALTRVTSSGDGGDAPEQRPGGA